MNQFFAFPLTLQRLREGPLGFLIDDYTSLLHQQGYSRQSACFQIRLLADLSRWLRQRSLRAEDINPQIIDRYLLYRKRRFRSRRSDRATVNKLLLMLHERGIVHHKTSPTIYTPRQRLEYHFKRYLLQERGLTPATCINYLPFIQKFLIERFGTNPIQLADLRAKDVIQYVQRHAYDLSHGRARLLVTALRVFFRYLRHQGDIATNLAACVPSVANWQLSTLPKFLQPHEVQRVLNHCDRQTAQGRRNYAILLLLARLGLRACEIVSLTLDDINWETGEITLRGKGSRLARIPLPQDVGHAIAAYLKKDRPGCSSRRIFISSKAPLRGFANSIAISTIVKRALAQAKINSPHKGAHIFRHTLATEMLRHGASLAEIGQLLRHQNFITTTIYAKVDLAALQTVTQPWPGGGQ